MPSSITIETVVAPDHQTARLAEMVFHLTNCSASDAIAALRAQPVTPHVLTDEVALARVAAAIVSLRD